MKIAIISGVVIPVPPAKYGGVERNVQYLIRGLKEMGHEPVLFGTGDSKVDCEIVPIVPEALPFKDTPEEEYEQEQKRQAAEKRLQEIVRDRGHEFDIINIHSFTDGTDLELYASFPHIITYQGVYNTSIINRLYQYKDKLNFSGISWNQISFVKNHLRFFSTIYNGYDPAEFEFVEKEDRDKYIAYLGRFSAEKTPQYALKLAKQMGMPVKAGGVISAYDRKHYQDYCASYFEQGNARYLGELDLPQKAELFGNAKYHFHLAEWREPFGNVVIEAGYCGTPSVVLNRGAMSEIVEDGKTGLIVEDIDEAYAKLTLEQHEFDSDYIKQHTAKMFNYRLMTKQHIKSYEDVIANQGKGHDSVMKALEASKEYRQSLIDQN